MRKIKSERPLKQQKKRKYDIGCQDLSVKIQKTERGSLALVL